MVIEVDYDGIDKMPEEEKLIKKVVKTVLKEEKILKDLEVYVTLTNNEQIHKVNLEQRKVDRPTDVLSFPMFERDEIPYLKEESDGERDILGDIIVSIEKVREQAEEYGHSFERELAYMVVHGFYHLMGYDHIELVDRTEMRAKEEIILNKLNITRGNE